MIINLSGLQSTKDIQIAVANGIDWISLDFRYNSEQYVSQISSHAGIIPDYSSLETVSNSNASSVKKNIFLCGIFEDSMPQTIITRIVSFGLDGVLLLGDESSVMIDNLRNSVDPDIRPGLKIAKRIVIRDKSDFSACEAFRSNADYFFFDFKALRTQQGSINLSVLDYYKEDIPYFVCGNLNLEDIVMFQKLNDQRFEGVSLNCRSFMKNNMLDLSSLSQLLG